MGAADVDVELAIIFAEIDGMDDAYARLALERIAQDAEHAIHMLPESHHPRFLAILRQARG